MGLTMCLAMGLGPGDKTQLNNDKARPQHSTPYLIPYLCIRMGHAHALYISCSANCRLYIIVIKREKFSRLLQDGFSRAPAKTMSGRALLKIPTMPSEAFAVISPKQDSSSSQESCLLVRNAPLCMEAWVASSTGREHARLGMVCLHAQEISADGAAP